MKTILSALALVGLLTMPALAQETRLFVDDLGNEVQIPVNPTRIVSMRGEQFSAPLLEMGGPLVGTATHTHAAVEDGQPYVRGAYDSLGFHLEGSGVMDVGSPEEYDFEAIARAEPDLIIIGDNHAEDIDRLSLIAPTVALEVWNQPMLDIYRKVADLANLSGAYERQLADYDARLERAKATFADTVGDPADISVAIVSASQDGGPQVYRNYGTLSQVIADLGLAVPDIIAQQTEPYAIISVELIQEVDADFLIDTYRTASGGSPATNYSDWNNMIPGWRDLLHAPRNNQFFLVNREEMRAVTFAAARSMLEVLVSQIAGREFVAFEE